MKKISGIGVLVLAVATSVLVSAGNCHAAATDTVVGLKPGQGTFKVFDSTGVNPVKNAEVKLTSKADPTKIITLKTDANGVVVGDVPAGEYILNVNGSDMATLSVSDTATVSECRIVMPADKAAGAIVPAAGGVLTTKSVIIGAAAIVTGVVVYDQVTKDDDKEDAVSK